MFDEPQGKPCPNCTAPLSEISSQFVRMCSNGKCGMIWFWPLNDGQAPLVTSSCDRSLPETN